MYTTWLNEKRFIDFDGLRALSILAVIVFHAAPALQMETPLTHAGHHGVELFFVISGFLITTLLIREKRNVGQIQLKNFYIRRSLRIFPLYYAVILLHVLLVLTLLRKTHPVESEQFLHNLRFFLSYTSNWFVTRNDETKTIFYIAWSLAAEEQFYLFWPPLLYACRRLTLPFGFILAVFAVSSIARTWETPLLEHLPELVVRIPANIPAGICIGVIASLLLHSRHGPAIFSMISQTGVLYSSWIVFLAAYGLTAYGFLPRMGLSFAMGLLVTSLASNRPHGLSPILRHPFFTGMGRVSYGMYLFHMLVLNALLLKPFHLLPRILILILVIGITYAVSMLSFLTFERFFLNMKRKFTPTAQSA